MGKARKAKAADEEKAPAEKQEDASDKPVRPRGPPQYSNALFEQCYRGTVVCEEEWSDFMAALRRELPVTFRFAATHPLSSALAAHLERSFASKSLGNTLKEEAEKAQAEQGNEPAAQCPLSRFPWLQGAWALALPKVALRKGAKELHEFLKRCGELGVISRQEAVSMAPVAMLGCRVGMKCLDVCAAPGMKTLQMIDAVATAEDAVAAIRHAGVLVANELDGRRCCMLAHHVLRARHPAAVVLHHSALALPHFGASAFDRVLCDVPCSGDGTIRKAPQLLASWRPNRSNALHCLQLRIACAGAAQLAEGGRMVYSTCALSPVENEAVVSALLLRAQGRLRLLDCSGELPGLQRKPGMESWAVRAGSRHCKSAALLQNPQEAKERGLDIPASAWPPREDDASRSVGLPGVLKHCWRLFPHLGDGGGFFLALLERLPGALPADFIPKEEEPLEAENSQKGEEPELPADAICKEQLPEAQREATLVAASLSERTEALVAEARAFYGLDAVPASNFFVRTDGDGRNIYLVSDALRDLLCASSGAKAMVAGVRAFDENRFLKSSGCRLRLVQEGARWLAPVMTKRHCWASAEEMLKLLSGDKVLFASLEQTSELRRALEAIDEQGSVAISCTLDVGAIVHVAAERGAECLSLFVNQHELRELRECLEEHLQPKCT